ncbi:MAG: HAMP domain-containing protein [Gemmatimonadetes bacterium]|nr:MAG: HAMP domain-containing protein [Gemmatimonadota bacterium]
MQTIRGRLTAWYSVALALTLAAFAAVLYLDRRSASYQDLDRSIQSEASLTAGMLAESYRARGVLVRPDSAGHAVLIPDLSALLEAVPEFLVITARDGSLLFASSDARALTFQKVEQLRELASAPISGRASGTVQLGADGPTIRYAVHYVSDAGPQFGAILAGANVRSAEVGPAQLLSTFALILPLGLMAALLMGTWIANRALTAVDQIITEVREITDGRSLHRRLAVPVVKDELGRLVQTLNQMLTRLERNFAALRRFTADASHELKTPLTVLRAGVERAITTPGLAQETLVTLEETLQEIKRMAELVDALLMLARADEGIAPLHREPVDLRSIVTEVQETGELLAEEAGVTMEVATPAEPVIVSVDASRIRQLILNLVTNAVKYTPVGGSVRMQLGPANGRVALSVADTGIGIAPGDLPHIFDRFWRADSARTRTGERPGAGLGLAICKWIAEAHGGQIDVVSRPGRGTTFTVVLPSAQP